MTDQMALVLCGEITLVASKRAKMKTLMDKLKTIYRNSECAAMC